MQTSRQTPSRLPDCASITRSPSSAFELPTLPFGVPVPRQLHPALALDDAMTVRRFVLIDPEMDILTREMPTIRQAYTLSRVDPSWTPSPLWASCIHWAGVSLILLLSTLVGIALGGLGGLVVGRCIGFW